MTSADTHKTKDGSAAVLALAHALLGGGGEPPDLCAVVDRLASAVGADAAGLFDGEHNRAVCGPASETWPAESPYSQARITGEAVVVDAGAGCRLAVRVPTSEAGWLVWATRGRPFEPAEVTSVEQFAWALGRANGGSRWAEQLERRTRQHRLEVAAGITRRLAHDFGNILTGILGFTELAQAQQMPASAPLAAYLKEIFQAAQAGAQFTNHLRLFTRRHFAGTRGSSPSVLLAEQEARLATRNDVRLSVDVPEDLPVVLPDSEHLHLVLSAVLDNACEAMPAGGSINVSARETRLAAGDCDDAYGSCKPGDYVEVIVADTGLGLTAEAERSLFVDPFFTTKTRRRGFGLAMSYGILHSQGGGLRLYPGTEGGVVVRLLLPVAPPQKQRLSIEPTVAVRAVARRGERVLVVDDESEVRSFVSAALLRAGYRVETASGGEAALRAYGDQGQDPFRLVLTDVLMPDITGVELAKRLLRKDPSVRVIFMSGHVGTDFTSQDFVAHRFDFLAKPFRTEQMLRAVRSALDTSERRQVRPPATPRRSPVEK